MCPSHSSRPWGPSRDLGNAMIYRWQAQTGRRQLGLSETTSGQIILYQLDFVPDNLKSYQLKIRKLRIYEKRYFIEKQNYNNVQREMFIYFPPPSWGCGCVFPCVWSDFSCLWKKLNKSHSYAFWTLQCGEGRECPVLTSFQISCDSRSIRTNHWYLRE